MGAISVEERTALRLAPFDERFAGVIAGWVQTVEQLRWLAPSTAAPLTAQKVVGWKRPDGHAFQLIRGEDPVPAGYAELNPMRQDAAHLWLGHVVVDPNLRGRGLGRALVRDVVATAFNRLDAGRISLVVFPNNIPAIQCYLRAGFALEGEEYHRFGDKGPRYRLLRLEVRRPASDVSDRP